MYVLENTLLVPQPTFVGVLWKREILNFIGFLTSTSAPDTYNLDDFGQQPHLESFPNCQIEIIEVLVYFIGVFKAQAR